jgi:hypothetical protein
VANVSATWGGYGGRDADQGRLVSGHGRWRTAGGRRRTLRRTLCWRAGRGATVKSGRHAPDVRGMSRAGEQT